MDDIGMDTIRSRRSSNMEIIKNSGEDAVPATYAQAKEESLMVWTHLRDHPELTGKLEIPVDMFKKIAGYKYLCALCAIFVVKRCTGCPLKYSQKPGGRVTTCRSAASAFSKHSNVKTAKARAKYAGEIVARIEAWNPEEV